MGTPSENFGDFAHPSADFWVTEYAYCPVYAHLRYYHNDSVVLNRLLARIGLLSTCNLGDDVEYGVHFTGKISSFDFATTLPAFDWAELVLYGGLITKSPFPRKSRQFNYLVRELAINARLLEKAGMKPEIKIIALHPTLESEQPTLSTFEVSQQKIHTIQEMIKREVTILSVAYSRARANSTEASKLLNVLAKVRPPKAKHCADCLYPKCPFFLTGLANLGEFLATAPSRAELDEHLGKRRVDRLKQNNLLEYAHSAWGLTATAKELLAQNEISASNSSSLSPPSESSSSPPSSPNENRSSSSLSPSCVDSGSAILSFDGSGNSRWGAVLEYGDGEELIWSGDGGSTSNESEYLALLNGLKGVKEALGTATPLTIKGDSQLVLRQLQGAYAVRADNLIPLYNQVKQLLTEFDEYTLQWVRREENERADEVCAGRADQQGS